MYGHITQCTYLYIIPNECPLIYLPAVAEAEKAGIEKAGGKADVYQYVTSLNFLFLHLTLSKSRRNPFRRNPRQDARPSQIRLPHHHPRHSGHL